MHLKSKIILAVLTVFLITSLGCLGGQEAADDDTTPTTTLPGDDTVAIDIKDFDFSPGTLTVKKGTTVVWTNQDSISHTSTALDGSFDSGALRKGDSYSFTFDEVGTFDYQCDFHPDRMKGAIRVEN